ncbi:MAG: Calx-beta domain-containing protein [Chloroflexota bacterium]|nr:Calx-beta domain-containing protein [Chloroflexota bacterium]
MNGCWPLRAFRTALRLWLWLVTALSVLSLVSLPLSGDLIRAAPLPQFSYTYTITATSDSTVTMGDMADQLSFIVTNTGNDSGRPIDYVRLEFDANLYDVSNAATAPNGWSVDEIQNAGQGQAYVIYIADSFSDALAPGESQTFSVAVLGQSNDVFERDVEDRTDTLKPQQGSNGTIVRSASGNRTFIRQGSMASWPRYGLAVSVVAVPPTVAVGELITVTMLIDNRSLVVQPNITRTLTYTPTGLVTLTSGPIPITMTLSPGSSDVITHTYQATAEGTVMLLGSSANANVTSGEVQSNAVVIGDFVAMMEVAPSSVIAGQNVTVRMRIYNNSGGTLGNIRPSALGFVGDASIVSFSGPSPNVVPSLPEGSTTTFEWTYTLTGTVGSTYVFTGTASANGPLVTNVARSNSGAISEYSAYVTPRRVGAGTPTPLPLAFTVANNGATTLEQFEFLFPPGFTALAGVGETTGDLGTPCTWAYSGGTFTPTGGCGGLPSGGTAVLTVTFDPIPTPAVDTYYNFRIDFCSGSKCLVGGANRRPGADWQGAVDVPFTITQYRIEVEANPTSLPADGFSTSVITATVYEGSSTVSGVNVVFASTGTQGTLSSYGGTTDANGAITVTFTTPVDFVDSQATIIATYLTAEGRVTIDLNGIGDPNPLYVGGTLSPLTVQQGEMIVFTLDVLNTGNQPITLTTASTFTFTDGIHTFAANLAASTVVPTDTQRTLTFTVTTVDPSFAPGDYYPVLQVVGTEAGQIYNRPVSDQVSVIAALTVLFSSANYSVSESAGTATITVMLSAASSLTITVDYATSDGTAIASSDYTAASGRLTFTPNVTIQTFTVTVTSDTMDENDETVLLTLSSPSNATIAGTNPATLTILDDDAPPTVQFSSGGYIVGEGDGAAAINVILSAASGLTVTVDYATSDGTARVADNDYTAASDTCTFSPGVTTQSFTVLITDDGENEPDETLSLTLSNPSNATVTGTNPATLIITDNDTVPDQVAIDKSVSPQMVQAPGQLITYTYTITISNAGPSSVGVEQITDTLPVGFTYITGTTTTSGMSNPGDPNVNGQELTWSYSSPYPRIDSGNHATLTFMVTSSNDSGTYCNSAGVTIRGVIGIIAKDNMACVNITWPIYQIESRVGGMTIVVRVRIEPGGPVILSWEILPW